ncbi:glycosyltransferase family 4 protein [Candidatus Uhrbacteria bacterium]|nr:glycosyltransferase family 4 protein [Candidatus Uhrbacteria bacterium]
MNLFYLFPDSCARKGITKPGHYSYKQTHLFYGMDHAHAYGHKISNDFDFCQYTEHGWFPKIVNKFLNRSWSFLGGSGGNWFKILYVRKQFIQADLIISTADRVGIPLVLLMAIGLVPKKPVLYISIGLPERWERLSKPMQHIYRRAFQKHVSSLVCFGYKEQKQLCKILAIDQTRIKFIPFGVNTEAIFPINIDSTKNILSIGADPSRDFDLLIQTAPSINANIVIITTKARAQELSRHWISFPSNVFIQTDVPFSELQSTIASSLFIVLPLHENSYSGATTTLLQCMAMGKAVIVSQTGAIINGYKLVDGENVMLVPPGEKNDLLHAMATLIHNPDNASKIGTQARKTVVDSLSWNQFEEKLFSLVQDCASSSR